MTVLELKELLGLDAAAMPAPEKEISGVYIGDLLSRVMGHAKSGNAWITIMSSINALAVATLADTSCIILAEGVRPDDGVRRTASEKGINILLSDLGAYDTALALSKLMC